MGEVFGSPYYMENDSIFEFFGGNLLMYNMCRWACLWILHPHLFHTLFE